MKNQDIKFMSLALELAKKGLGHTNPNPLVGAVLVRNGKIIGTGFHEKYGGHHAEVNAINDAILKNEKIEGSTLYVNLEPCSHTNKQTPPCAPLIVKEKISRVVVSNIDPNPSVSGRGIELLSKNNIEVTVGVLDTIGEKLNEVFFTVMRKQRPFLHLKMAQTLDGKVATAAGESKYITGEISRSYVHKLRQGADAIIIGKNTLLLDNPELTVRLTPEKVSNPLRIIFCDLKTVELNLDRLKVFNDQFRKNTMLVTTDSDLSKNIKTSEALESKGVAILALKANLEGRVDLNSFMKSMFSLKLYSLFLEGGPMLASEFLKEKLVDKVSFITAPVILGEGRSSLNYIGINSLDKKLVLQNIMQKNLGQDYLVEGYICSPDL